MNSVRNYKIMASTENWETFKAGIADIINSDTSENSECMYSLNEILDAVMDLKVNDLLQFQPNRDDANSKGFIVRIQ